MKNKLVSFVIPTYNRAGVISETLDSIKNQSYENWECIVVDDGSTDDTQTIVQQYIDNDQRFTYVSRPQNRKKGGNAARNYGFEVSQGEFVNFVDSDDLIHKDKLKLQLNVLDANKNCQVCLSEAEIFNDIKRYQKESKPLDQIDFFRDYIARELDMGTTQPLWRKEFLSATPLLYDENILRGQDFDFLSRMSSRKDFAYCYVPEILVSVRIGNEGRISDMGYKKEVARSYLESFYKTYLLVQEQFENKEYYTIISNLLLKRILKSIVCKDFETSLFYLKKMKAKVFKNKVNYKNHFRRIILLLRVLRFTDLKGYGLLRRNYYLS